MPDNVSVVVTCSHTRGAEVRKLQVPPQAHYSTGLTSKTVHSVACLDACGLCGLVGKYAVATK